MEDRPGASDHRVYLWAALGTIFFSTAAVWWVSTDQRPQQMDPATHLRRAVFYGIAIREGSPRQLYHLWRTEYGMYTYPPLFHVMAGAWIAAGASPQLAAALTNLCFAWILLISVIKLGRAAFNLAAGVAAGALCLSFMTIAFLQRTAFPDFALTAMVAWCCWRLVLSDAFASRRHSIIFGAVVGLAMLAKQMALPFVAVVALALLLSKWRGIGRGVMINVLLAGAAAGVVALPWYGYHHRIIRQIGHFNQYVAPQREGDPMPWTWEGATYYVQTIFTQLGPLLFVLAIAGALGWLLLGRRRVERLPRDQRGRDGRLVIVAWLIGGLLLVTFILLNKDYRYHAPILPALALVMASLLAWPATQRARMVIGIFMLLAAAPYFLLATVGTSNEAIPRLLATQWNMPPMREDWGIDSLVQDVAAATVQVDRRHPPRLGIVPFCESYGHPSLHLEFVRRRLPIVVEGFEEREPADAAEMDLVLTKTGEQGQEMLARDPELVNRYIIGNPAIFTAIASYPLPDGSRATLYRVSKQLSQVTFPGPP